MVKGMPKKIQVLTPKRTFVQRLRSITLWWGLPSICVELFGVPRHLWVYALPLIVPATVVGVVAGALVLHVVAARRNRAEDVTRQ
jgi:hypothetical protein